jgi:hypothetical protein
MKYKNNNLIQENRKYVKLKIHRISQIINYKMSCNLTINN